jgi:hypothetical protein
MSARPLLFALCHACRLLLVACGQASAVTLRLCGLPEGKEPALRTVCACVGPASTCAAAAPRGLFGR